MSIFLYKLSSPMKTLADRIWYAYHCLPRTGRMRKPPTRRSLEIKYGLSNGMLGRLLAGERQHPEPETLVALSKMFGVSLDWLMTGDGVAPVATEPVPPRVPYLVEDGTDPSDAVSRATTLLWMAVQEKPDGNALELLSLALSIGLRTK